MPALLDQFSLKAVTLRNRIAIAPMCQYMADDGMVGDWHLAHLGARAIGGAGLVIAEGTAVSPEGRITARCAGLWNDRQVAPWARIVSFVKAQGAVPGIQLAHAGRKAATNLPWVEAGAQLPPDHPDAWQPIGPSARAFGGTAPRVPCAMTEADIMRVQRDFAAAAGRAQAAGFEWLELHFGHGYLAQSFLSPTSNSRDDGYGGALKGRARFLLECIDAVRTAWPENLPLTVKLGVTDFVQQDRDIAESIALILMLKERGVDLVDVSIDFSTPDVSRVPWGPAMMAPIAANIRAATQIPVAVGWMVNRPEQADAIIKAGQADLVMLGRASLADPHWPYHAARTLGSDAAETLLPIQTGDWLRPRA